ncbi:MAG: hypothetical protein WCE75_14205 [Terracidiphilus sp.]
MRPLISSAFAVALCAIFAAPAAAQAPAAASPASPADAFRTAERCIVCHNTFRTEQGEDATIGAAWRASIMAHSARDPYWLASVRRETQDHSGAAAAIETECAACHMPLQRQIDQAANRATGVFAHLPFKPGVKTDPAADGVSCTACHQMQPAGLGTPATFNGNFTVAPLLTEPRPVFGPFAVDSDRVMQMHVASTGYAPVQSDHIRQASLCASCHTLYTTSLGPGGKQIGKLPEQMVYLEWEHSDYAGKQTCQQCHMPAVNEPVKVAALLAEPREGVRRHAFAGSNFLMESVLSTHHDELGVAAPPADLDAAAEASRAFLRSQSARVTLGQATRAGGQLRFPVRVENLAGHKLPTSFPSRRAWLHVTVTAADGSLLFESGKLNPDGSIAENTNDADPTAFLPHFSRITSPKEVEIYESILGDPRAQVTTGLLSATQYLKDNRILPSGFDKKTASPDIAVRGSALTDPGFTAGSSTTEYVVPAPTAGRCKIAVELLYQPIGFRWARNLASYKSAETEHFAGYFDQAAASSAEVLAHAEVSVP